MNACCLRTKELWPIPSSVSRCAEASGSAVCNGHEGQALTHILHGQGRGYVRWALSYIIRQLRKTRKNFPKKLPRSMRRWSSSKSDPCPAPQSRRRNWLRQSSGYISRGMGLDPIPLRCSLLSRLIHVCLPIRTRSCSHACSGPKGDAAPPFSGNFSHTIDEKERFV